MSILKLKIKENPGPDDYMYINSEAILMLMRQGEEVGLCTRDQIFIPVHYHTFAEVYEMLSGEPYPGDASEPRRKRPKKDEPKTEIPDAFKQAWKSLKDQDDTDGGEPV